MLLIYFITFVRVIKCDLFWEIKNKCFKYVKCVLGFVKYTLNFEQDNKIHRNKEGITCCRTNLKLDLRTSNLLDF